MIRSKSRAEALALKLLRRMKTPGWKTRLWKNLGWHYSLQNGFVSLHVSSAIIGGDHYFAMVDYDEGGSGGLSMWTKSNSSSFKDPNKAVEAAITYALPIMDHITGIRSRISALVKSGKFGKPKKSKSAKSDFREVNGRLKCRRCGYELSAMLGDNEIPERCECHEDDETEEKPNGTQSRRRKAVSHPDRADRRSRRRS